jgi:hypothetical protein
MARTLILKLDLKQQDSLAPKTNASCDSVSDRSARKTKRRIRRRYLLIKMVLDGLFRGFIISE